jgi:hypothetical protein
LHTSGNIEFIPEDNDEKAKADCEAYRQRLGQAKESRNLSPADLQTKEARSVVEDDTEGHWVTIDGVHVFIFVDTGTIQRHADRNSEFQVVTVPPSIGFDVEAERNEGHWPKGLMRF